MKKSCLFLLASLLFLVSCDKNTIKIEGSFEDNSNDGKLVFLQTMDSRDLNSTNIQILDSAEVKNGKFQINTSLEETPIIGLISIGKIKDAQPGDNPIVGSIAVEPGTTKISFSKSNYTLSGTPRNEEMNKVVAVMSKFTDIQDEVVAAGSVEAVPVDESGLDVMGRMHKLSEEMRAVSFDFTKANMNNKLGEFMFMTTAEAFTDEQLKELLTLADSAFLKQPAITSLQQMLNGDPMSHSHNDMHTHDDITFENVQLVDMDGKIVSLSDYVGKGKYVLVDFWATWCGPCMQEVPNLIKAYGAYRSKGFEIVGISLDQDKDAWKRVVKEKGMLWVQLHDTSQQAATLYNVVSIPYTLLFDKDGEVVAMNLRGGQLEQKLSELLK
jgi:thiol-disulfide isomerase/thioredoxin